MRDLINQMKTSIDPNYCVRVTAERGARGEQWLRTFQDNEKTIPTILTTSQKLSTGVDARNVRNIVLMRPINSMIEFKQIIGRGTRLFEGKDYFTIFDFVKAYEHFNDPNGMASRSNLSRWLPQPPAPADGLTERKAPADEPHAREAPAVKIKLADGKERTIQHISSTSFWSPDGKPISANAIHRELFGELPQLFKDEDELRRIWSQPDTRKLDGRSGRERFRRRAAGEIRRNRRRGQRYIRCAGLYRLLAPITRLERVEAAKRSIFSRYDSKLQVIPRLRAQNNT